MSLLIAKGSLISKTTREIEFLKGNKKERFSENKIWILGQENSAPGVVQVSDDTFESLSVGEAVELPVYIKTWTSKAGKSGFTICESTSENG